MRSIEADRVAGICITHQRESFAPVNEDNHAQYNAILWDDARSEAQLAELGERFGHDDLHRRTGRGPSLTQSFSKILWLVQNHPDIARDAHKFMDVHGFLVQRLTGKFTTSLASADSFGLIDAEHDAWAEDLITGIGLRPEQFCDTVRPGEVIGELTAEAARATGLPAGLPVVAGLGDGQAACLGAGVTSLDRAYFNLGTAVTGGPIEREYVTDPSCRTLYGGAARDLSARERPARRHGHHDLVHAPLRRHHRRQGRLRPLRDRGPQSGAGGGRAGPGAVLERRDEPVLRQRRQRDDRRLASGSTAASSCSARSRRASAWSSGWPWKASRPPVASASAST